MLNMVRAGLNLANVSGSDADDLGTEMASELE